MELGCRFTWPEHPYSTREFVQTEMEDELITDFKAAVRWLGANY